MNRGSPKGSNFAMRRVIRSKNLLNISATNFINYFFRILPFALVLLLIVGGCGLLCSRHIFLIRQYN